MAAQPLDGDRATAGADVPQALTRRRRKSGERYRPHFALGELAVVAEGVVGQAGHAGADDCGGTRNTFHRDRVEGESFTSGPAFGNTGQIPLVAAAHMLEHSEAAEAVAERGQRLGHGPGRGAIMAQQQQLRTGRDDAVEEGKGPAMERQALDLGERPTEPRAGECEGGDSRHDPGLLGRHSPQQRDADAEPERIAGRQHDDATFAPLQDLVDREFQRRCPAQALGGPVRHLGEVTLAADERLRALD